MYALDVLKCGTKLYSIGIKMPVKLFTLCVNDSDETKHLLYYSSVITPLFLAPFLFAQCERCSSTYM